MLAIDHVGIAVADLDTATAWYQEHLGLQAVHEEVNEEQGVREVMLAVGGSSTVSPASGASDLGTPAGACIQLLAPLRADSPIGRFLDRSGPGIQQLALRVRDLDGLTERLRGQDISLLYDVAKGGTAGSRVNFMHPKDTGGVLIELVEPAVVAASSTS